MAEDKTVEKTFGTLKMDNDENKHGDDEGADETNEDGVLFYVNKGSFPINTFTWERMWQHVNKLHPEGQSIATEIQENKNLPEVHFPKPPVDFSPSCTIDTKLEAIQNYMNELQYNHTGTQFFEIRKNRPISGLMESAKEMIREALPIKCLEAVILSIHLTNSLTNVDRFPISFKTVFMGHVYRHVVLGVYSAGWYGALGMSRRTDLMYKPLEFRSLSELVMNYVDSYRKYFHDVKKTKVGLPVPHDCHSYESICWKHLTVTPKKKKNDEICREIDRHAREMRQQRTRMENLRNIYHMGTEKVRTGHIYEAPVSPSKSAAVVKKSPPKQNKTKATKINSPQKLETQQSQIDTSTTEASVAPAASGTYHVRV